MTTSSASPPRGGGKGDSSGLRKRGWSASTLSYATRDEPVPPPPALTEDSDGDSVVGSPVKPTASSSTSDEHSSSSGDKTAKKEECVAPTPSLPHVKTGKQTRTSENGVGISRPVSDDGVAQVAVVAADALVDGDVVLRGTRMKKKFPDDKKMKMNKMNGGRSPAKPTRSATAGADMSIHATRAMSSERPRRNLSVWDYCCAELGLSVGAREDDPDMAVARERVFDIIWYIPLEFERLNFYGGLLCADAVLGVVTSLPVRVVCQTTRLFFSPAVGVLSFVGLGSGGDGGGGGGGGGGVGGGGAGGWNGGAGWGQSRRGRVSSSKRKSWGFHPYAREHLGDSLWLLMLAAAVAANQAVDVSVVYHYIRGQEVIKLYMACSVLECFDKLCCAFNCHVLDALQNSVYLVVNTAATSGSTSELLNACFQLSFDAALTLMATVAHTMIMLTHAVTLSVAINSHTNAMLLVLISNNFGEIKGHVFKRMDPDKLFSVARMDIVERVHLSICLLFVAAQRVTAAGSLAGGLTRKMLVDSMMVLGSEVGVDVFKHAFMSKFNALRPKVYRGFFRQLCREHVKLAQSYKLHRVVGFVPLAPAAVLIKVLPDLYRTLMPAAAESDGSGGGGGGGGSQSYGFGGGSGSSYGFNGGGGGGAWGFNSGGDDLTGGVSRGVGGGGGGGIAAGEGHWLSWLDEARLQFFDQFSGLIQRVMPHPREAALFLLGFLALLIFKLAFGIALHWFGVFMLEYLPADHHTSGAGARAGGGGKSFFSGTSASSSSSSSAAVSDKVSDKGKSGGVSDTRGNHGAVRKGGEQEGGGGESGVGMNTKDMGGLPAIPGSPKTPPKHRLFAPI